MRLPLVPQLSTKDGVSNKNARLINMLKEPDEAAELAVVRPGLRRLAGTVGNGKGLVNFNDTLVSVYGSNIIAFTGDPVVFNSPTGGVTNIASDGIRYVGIDSANGTFASVKDNVLGTGSTSAVTAFNNPIVYGDGKYVTVVSGTNSGMYSTDGYIWSNSTLPASGTWADIAHNGTNFCFIGGSGNAYYSSDGITWNTSTTGFPGYWSKIVWNGTVFCAFRSNSTSAATSTDGNVWTFRTVPWPTRGIAYTIGATIFAMSSEGHVMQSADNGATWSYSAPTIDPENQTGFVTQNATYVGIVFQNTYGFWYTTDGTTFELLLLPKAAAWTDLATDGDGFAVASPDGEVVLMYPNGFTTVGTASGDFFDFAQSTL